MVLRNQIQNEPFNITASGKQTSNPLLSEQGGFHLPSDGGLWSLPRSGGFGLSDGGYSSESKQVRENLTGGLTEVPDRHAHKPESEEQVGDDGNADADLNASASGQASPQRPTLGKVRDSARKAAERRTRVAGTTA